MCGIAAGVAQRDIAELLIEGLKRLEYRGYDSAGLAVLNNAGEISRVRTCGKVNALKETLSSNPLEGKIGVAHTRWATHGKPSETNAHPHMFLDKIALVHNGIIENHEELKQNLISNNLEFYSETDTEVIVNCLGKNLSSSASLLEATQKTVSDLTGAYALAVISKTEPDKIIAARKGSPLVIGVGLGENFVASDSMALLPFTQNIMVLEEGDIAEITRTSYQIYNKAGEKVNREVKSLSLDLHNTDRGEYRHFMQKEIFEQPEAICNALEGRVLEGGISDEIFGAGASDAFDRAQAIKIVACGTSFHAGLVAKYWFEAIAGIHCEVEIASESRYRKEVVLPGTLLVTLSQSGETADTLAALNNIDKEKYCGTLCICNVAESSLVRSSDYVLLTHAGPEIGVASTKAFTTQLAALYMLVIAIGRRNSLNKELAKDYAQSLRHLPSTIEQILELDTKIQDISQKFQHANHALFLGRGIHYPIAKEGALKLKEISYIHAEAYPAGGN
jgi:glutamine---fructose-6-phosphate transaminase (isomerizing)